MSLQNQSLLAHRQRAQVLNLLITAGVHVHVALQDAEIGQVRFVQAVRDSHVPARFNVVYTLGEASVFDTKLLALGESLKIHLSTANIEFRPAIAAFLNQLIDAGAYVSFPLTLPQADVSRPSGLLTKVETTCDQEETTKFNMWYEQSDMPVQQKQLDLNDPLDVYLNVGA